MNFGKAKTLIYNVFDTTYELFIATHNTRVNK